MEIKNERILELPLNGRQVTDLIVLAGSAVTAGAASHRNMNGGVGISVAGGLSSGVSYILDGAMHNDPSRARLISAVLRAYATRSAAPEVTRHF